MKKVLLLFFIGCLTYDSFSQSLPFSTFRAVYDFAVGDTFETTCFNSITFVTPHCTIENTYLDIILSRQDFPDFVVYTIDRNYHEHWSDGTHNTNSTSNYPITVTYAYLDSAVFWDHTHTNLGCDSNNVCLYDTVYLDSTCTGKTNQHRTSDWGNSNDTVYADGLGLIEASLYSEDYDVTQGGCSLIYYHKVNGKQCGHPNYSFFTSIADIENNSLKVNLSPNPASSSVTISVDESMIGGNATVSDITGRKMLGVPLSTVNCQLSTDNLSNGVYFVTVSNKEGRSATKKLVKQ